MRSALQEKMDRKGQRDATQEEERKRKKTKGKRCRNGQQARRVRVRRGGRGADQVACCDPSTGTPRGSHGQDSSEAQAEHH